MSHEINAEYLTDAGKELAASAFGLCAMAAGEMERDSWRSYELIMRAQVELQAMLGFNPTAAPIYPRRKEIPCLCFRNVGNLKCRVHGAALAVPTTTPTEGAEGKDRGMGER